MVVVAAKAVVVTVAVDVFLRLKMVAGAF